VSFSRIFVGLWETFRNGWAFVDSASVLILVHEHETDMRRCLNDTGGEALQDLRLDKF